ncbi:MAG TPA: pentapeptide repeat-containing protein [Candidatus Kapabacteria bacterium]|nr:pentapeptide repeat-containing protein [Candidatus Kapabacteria bacterium]
MKKTEGIPLTKPKSIWVKPIKIKLQLFKNLFNLFKDSLQGDFLKIPADVLDTFSGLELKTEIGERGWLLVSRALMDAMIKLVEEHTNSIHVDAVVPDHLDTQLNEILENQAHYLGFDFFENPKKLELLTAFQPVYCEFLADVGFEPAMADNICNRLTGYFVLALMDEWRKNAGYYQPLEDSIKTPFDKAGLEEKEWLHYLAWLKKQPDEPVFGETFGLRQVYIPLRGFHKEKVKGKDRDSGEGFKNSDGAEEYKKIAFDLEEKLIAWVDTADKNDALRIIAGGPGYGKSSFLKIFAARLAEINIRVLFVPLHRFEIKEDLIDALQKFIRFNGYLTHDLLGSERLVVIFDGLDELAMQGKGLADAANQFIREIKMKLGNLNSQKNRLQVIVSGRDIIIQANEAEFRKEHQLLHILPYYINEAERKEYTAKKGFLETDQRDSWWENYGKIKGKAYPGLPGELKNEDLDKLTVQPLLNYLVALSFERGKLQFSQHTNLNEIYEDLLGAVHHRSYDEGRIHRAVDRLEYNHFIRILEEIALCAWQGDGRTTTAADIEQHCQDAGLAKILECFKQSAKEGIISFMTAFYFRKAGQRQQATGEETFEFTHKSFGEFLAGRRIVNKIKQIHNKRREKESNFDEGLGDKECLTEWIKLFGPKELDKDLLKFIANEIEALGKKNKEEVKGLQETVIRLMNHMLKNGMPMETVALSSYFIENIQAINAEKALLIILSTIADITGEISNIAWPSLTAFGELISRLQGQRTGGDNFILRFLNRLNLEKAFLDIKDFYHANFQETNLSRVSLIMANLRRADLSEANLSEANLREANLWRADLRGANLREANLREANLRGANLSEADLGGANLSGADLRGARVTEEELKVAKIDETTKIQVRGRKRIKGQVPDVR